MKEFSKGDSVEWNTSQGKTTGQIVKKVTKATQVGRHVAKPSVRSPEYLVETTATHKLAVHKPDSLQKR